MTGHNLPITDNNTEKISEPIELCLPNLFCKNVIEKMTHIVRGQSKDPDVTLLNQVAKIILVSVKYSISMIAKNRSGCRKCLLDLFDSK